MLAARQNFLIMLQKYATDALKTSSKRLIQKTAEATGDFIDNKIADRVRKVSKNWKQNHSEKVMSEYDKETPKERYISRKTQEVTDELRFKLYNNSIWKTPEATGDFISKKIAKVSKKIKIIVQRQLQTRMIKQYLKKNIYFQKKGTKLLIIWQLIQYYNSIIIKYPKKIYCNIPNQPSKFRIKSWVEITDDARGRYNTNYQIRFRTSMARSVICDYSDAYILVIVTITVKNSGTATDPNNRVKKVIFKNIDPFANCISEINNKEIYHANDNDVVIPMYNLIEYSDNYSKTSGSLWKHYRDESFIDNNCYIVDVPDFPDSGWSKYK